MNAAAYTVPNPHDMAYNPTHEDENPHTKMTKEGALPALVPNPETLRVPFTLQAFPRLVMPFGMLTQNLCEEQVVQIRADPPNFLAVVPFDAGMLLYKKKPHLNQEVANFLRTLVPAGTDLPNLQVAMPRPFKANRMKRDYDGPWPIILSGISNEMRQFLLWHQTFATSKDLTFNVLEFNLECQSWVVMTIGGDAVQDTTEAKKRVLATLKEKLWSTDSFTNFVDATLARKGVEGPKMKRVVEATSSFALTYIETGDNNAAHAPVFQLTAKPLSDVADTQREWIAQIRLAGSKCFVGMYALEIEKRFVDCVHCKSKMHPGHNCAQPKVEGWLGPVPNDRERYNERMGNQQSGSSHENNDRRGRGRRNERNDGWSTVSHRGTGRDNRRGGRGGRY